MTGRPKKFLEKHLQSAKKCGIINCILKKGKVRNMKAGIHPSYEDVTIICACGNVVKTKSTTGGEMKVEICSKCHPFFTGKQKLVDAGGRVDKFNRRLQAKK